MRVLSSLSAVEDTVLARPTKHGVLTRIVIRVILHITSNYYYYYTQLLQSYYYIPFPMFRFRVVEHWLAELEKVLFLFSIRARLYTLAVYAPILYFIAILLAQDEDWNFISSTAKPPLLALPSRINRHGLRASIATWAAIHTGRGLLSPFAVNDHNCNTKYKKNIV